MVKDLETAMSYYRDTLGFNVRGAQAGAFDGSLTASISIADMSSFNLLGISDSAEENTVPEFIQTFLSSDEGVRLYSLSSSSADSTFSALTTNGYAMDSVEAFRNTARKPEGWSWDDGEPTAKSLDFDVSNPPAHLPRFIESVGYDYAGTDSDWRTYYVYGRMFNGHANGVIGMSAIRVAVEDLDASHDEFEKMGFELIDKTETTARYELYRNHELHLVSAKTDQSLQDFVAKRGEGVFALRFEVEQLDSTYQYFENELPEEAFSKSADLITILPEHAFGVQLEFEQESDEQGLMARKLMPKPDLDSVAIVHAQELYTKYCTLCHGDNREGYAADNAPSLRSKSLLATSKNNNFMRYTIQFGRGNSAMAGYLKNQGGPMEYIEIELLLEWLYQMAEVEEPIDLSREPVLGDIDLGARVYKENCAVCHGENGEGISAPALANPMLLATATDHFLRYAIAEGRDGTPMIAFKDSLSDEKIDGLTAFLRSRASGWDIPKLDSVVVPKPEEYVLNEDNEAPVFELKDGKFVSAEQVNQAIKDNKRMVILDARSEVAWRQMHIPGAIPVPYYQEPEEFINDIPNDGTQIVIYCACPHAASERVLSTLKRNGFKNAAIIDEGILVWAQMGFPVRNGS
ncbi:hypothetical protein BFP97_04075 [Roseivirga sp. 4D4]|nr:hypothetical protein BFP97_04075 [Roseivirga sp. 4D4]